MKYINGINIIEISKYNIIIIGICINIWPKISYNIGSFMQLYIFTNWSGVILNKFSNGKTLPINGDTTNNIIGIHRLRSDECVLADVSIVNTLAKMLPIYPPIIISKYLSKKV